MGRPKKFDDAVALEACLQAILAHPWADAHVVQALAHLSRRRLAPTLAQARALGYIEMAHVPAQKRRPAPRYGLTPPGAARLGQPYAAPFWRATLLETLRLDPARLLLVELACIGRVVWALSPFTLPANALRPLANPYRPAERPTEKVTPYRSLPLEALACVEWTPGRYVNLAVLVDPGGIPLTWFDEVFRSWMAWHRRPEFHNRRRAFPLLIIVAANPGRRIDLIQRWRQAARGAPPNLRVITGQTLAEAHHEKSGLDHWLWWNERNSEALFAAGLIPDEQPSRRPAAAAAEWWATLARTRADFFWIPQTLPPSKRRRGVLALARQKTRAKKNAPAKKKRASLRLTPDEWRLAVQDQQAVSAFGRQLLDRLGIYPLLSAADMALVLGLDKKNVCAELARLRERTLITQPETWPNGYVLTWRGVVLLALQAGFPPAQYAELRRWKLQRDRETGAPQYGLDSWLRIQAHTEIVIKFLAGLRRCGPAVSLRLAQWEHLMCLQEFPATLDDRPAQVVPDARGIVRQYGATVAQYVDTPFWLEVDRGSKIGNALTEKLARYYRVGGPAAGMAGRPERLLIVVERDAEARLQTLRRRLQALNARYHTRLDVRLTRLDLLADSYGRLDPTRKVWRTVESSEFRHAFEAWGETI